MTRTPVRADPRLARLAAVLLVFGTAIVLLAPRRATALPSFARKYQTSCETCHTIFPKLNPFGEAFRRNGYRFPGEDSDYWQGKTVSLGRAAYKKMFPNAVWPGVVQAFAPLSMSFNGQAIIHPDTNATAARADNKTVFNMDSLVEEGHLYAAGSFDEKNTYYAEVTFGGDGSLSVEKAQVLFNDLLGPAHLLNLEVGEAGADVNSFGLHSTYIDDQNVPQVQVTGLYGTQNPWSFNDNHMTLELNGVVAGRFDYSLGLQSGSNIDVRPTENSYVHVGYKIGGARLDGENYTPANPMKPWEEDALTLDLFGYHSNTRLTNAAGVTLQDVATTLGGALRAQWASWELDAGAYGESHSHASDVGSPVDAFVQYDELSWVAFPWLVPAARFEYIAATGDGTTQSTWRIEPGIVGLIRPNLKLRLVGDIEAAHGAPVGGWGDPADGATIVPPSGTAKTGPEVEALVLFLQWGV